MRSLRTMAAGLAVTLTLVVATLAFSPSAAQAAPHRPAARSYYGAIVMSRDAAIGFGYNYATRAAAYKRATQGCHNHSSLPGQCRKIGWVRNGCGAVAVHYGSNGYVTRYKYGYGRTRAAAQNAAKRNFGGRIRGYVCTSR